MKKFRKLLENVDLCRYVQISKKFLVKFWGKMCGSLEDYLGKF